MNFNKKSKKIILLTEFEELTLDKLDVVATLGIGGFGRVALVQMAKDKR